MNLRILVLSLSILTMIGCQSTSPVGQPSTSQQSPQSTSQNRAEVGDTQLLQQAQSALQQQNFELAQQYLSQLNERRPADYLLIAETCQGLRDYQCAADGFIQASLELGFENPALPSNIHDLIWQSLGRAAQGPVIFSHRYHHAWWLLQQEMRTAKTIGAQQDAWRQWQQAYPSHPARLQPPGFLQALENYVPPRIAVFLPTTGPYASVGRAVRDGLLAAHLEDHSTQTSTLSFYDTHNQDIAQLWEQALNDGAQVSVGPLLKQNAQKFAQLSQYSNIPRLTLNYLDSPTNSNSLFQLGISIEDEASALVNHVLESGVERLMIVHSGKRWSARAYEEFKQQWPFPLHSAEFTDIKELTGAIGSAMQVAASEQRHAEIQRILGTKLEFLARGRGDLDAVIALTNQVESLALIPALRFHFASNLPIYATSQAARGNQLSKLKGFSMTEMPLFLNPDPAQTNLRAAFNLDRNGQQRELYALGYDGYQVASRLPTIDQQGQINIAGASGYLWLVEDGKFRRDLNLGRVSNSGIIELQ